MSGCCTIEEEEKTYNKVTQDEAVSFQLNTVTLAPIKYFMKTMKRIQLYLWKFTSNEVIQTGNSL
jgi:hypothetical protein